MSKYYPFKRFEPAAGKKVQIVMMRVAIAGTNGLAYWIAYFLHRETSHQFIILSRTPKPLLTEQGWQVLVVDYGNESDLQFNLAGVDLVISLVSGAAQLALIDAAFNVGVRRFAPAEFAGSSLLRPAGDALDRGQSAALTRLYHYAARGMTYTVLSCGILYERFGPGGTAAANIGQTSGNGSEGDYLMNVRELSAQVPLDSSGQPAIVCLTSAKDVGKFVVAALDLPDWPTELRMYGERRNVSDIIRVGEQMRNQVFQRGQYDFNILWSYLLAAQASGDLHEQRRIYMLMATGEGRFDFTNANLNVMVNVIPESFEQWLHNAWRGQF